MKGLPKNNKANFNEYCSMEKRIAKLEKTISTLTAYVVGNNNAISEGLSKVNSNFEKITTHLKKIDAELKIINAKVDSLDGNTGKNFNKVEVKLDDLKSEIKKIGNVTGYDDLLNNLKIVNKK